MPTLFLMMKYSTTGVFIKISKTGCLLLRLLMITGSKFQLMMRNEITIIWDKKIIQLENPGKINYKIIRVTKRL